MFENILIQQFPFKLALLSWFCLNYFINVNMYGYILEHCCSPCVTLLYINTTLLNDVLQIIFSLNGRHFVGCSCLHVERKVDKLKKKSEWMFSFCERGHSSWQSCSRLFTHPPVSLSSTKHLNVLKLVFRGHSSTSSAQSHLSNTVTCGYKSLFKCMITFRPLEHV